MATSLISVTTARQALNLRLEVVDDNSRRKRRFQVRVFRCDLYRLRPTASSPRRGSRRQEADELIAVEDAHLSAVTAAISASSVTGAIRVAMAAIRKQLLL